MTIEAARKEWLKRIASSSPGQLLLDIGVLRSYYGIDDFGRPVFLVVSSTPSDAPKLADLVRIDHGKRPDGTWTVILTLTEVEYAEAFVGMCLEVIRRASDQPDEVAALQVFDSTINDWRQLLSLKGARRLSDAEVRGLAAELLFLKACAVEVGAKSAIGAWVGPHGAPQDFRFGGGRVFEVKATRIGATTVHISSIEQLEAGVADKLTLAVIEINDVPGPVPQSFTLASLVREVRDLARNDQSLIDQLDQKLALLQLDVSDSYYSDRNFEHSQSHHYLVADGFPRISTLDVPIGVMRVKYEVELRAIDPFLHDELRLIGDK